MHDKMIKYKEKVGSKRATYIVNRVSVNGRPCIADVLKSGGSKGVRLVRMNPPVTRLPRCQGYVPLTLDVVRVAFKVPLALHTPL